MQGLSEAEAAIRLARDGRNELRRPKGKSLIHRFLEQLQDPLIYVLMVAAFVSVVLGEFSDAGIIAAVVLLNACVGLVQEGEKGAGGIGRFTKSCGDGAPGRKRKTDLGGLCCFGRRCLPGGG